MYTKKIVWGGGNYIQSTIICYVLIVKCFVKVSDEDRQEAMVTFGPLSQLAYLCLPRDQLKALTLFSKDGPGESCSWRRHEALHQLVWTWSVHQLVQSRTVIPDGAVMERAPAGACQERCTNWFRDGALYQMLQAWSVTPADAGMENYTSWCRH